MSLVMPPSIQMFSPVMNGAGEIRTCAFLCEYIVNLIVSQNELHNKTCTAVVLTALQQAAKAGKAVLVVSHETDAEAYADRIYHMNHGTIE